MRALGWIFIVLGAVGVIACIVGIVQIRAHAADAAETTEHLASRSRELLDLVDTKLVVVPERLRGLVERKNEGVIGRELGQLEDTLSATHETATSILSLLRVATMLRGGGSVEEQFPKVVEIVNLIAQGRDVIAAQRADVKTWTLRAAALDSIVSDVRADVAETRAETERIEGTILTKLDTVVVLLTVFLLWMGLGQATLVLQGRRTAATES